jgi:hypothetical protein
VKAYDLSDCSKAKRRIVEQYVTLRVVASQTWCFHVIGKDRLPVEAAGTMRKSRIWIGADALSIGPPLSTIVSCTNTFQKPTPTLTHLHTMGVSL